MAISIKLQRNRFAPVILCDICAEEITDEKKANCEWLVAPDGDDIIGPVFTHKVDCSHRLEYRWREQDTNHTAMWESLRILPLYLRNNLQLKEKDLQAAAKFAAVLE